MQPRCSMTSDPDSIRGQRGEWFHRPPAIQVPQDESSTEPQDPPPLGFMANVRWWSFWWLRSFGKQTKKHGTGGRQIMQ